MICFLRSFTMKMNRIFMIDFDGTITLKDTCVAMVEAFAKDGWQEINEKWERKELSTEQCANETFRLFDATMADLLALMDQIEVDPYFMPFYQALTGWGDRAYILSDGYDVVIDRILKREKLDIPFYANQLFYTENGFTIGCPYHNPNCGKCGVCKTNLIKLLKKPNEQVVYIGDGSSDRCAVESADIVFAKGSLYRYCVEKGIVANPFDRFDEILRFFEKPVNNH